MIKKIGDYEYFGGQYRILTDRGIVICDDRTELDEEKKEIESLIETNK